MKDEQKTKAQLITEVTELRRRVAELETAESQRSREEELLHIFRISSPIGLFIIQDGKFQFINDEFHRVTGGKVGELLGTDPIDRILPEDREMVRENAIKMLKGERFSPYKYRIVNREGQIRWMLEGVVSVSYRGRRAVLGHSMDITERVEAEAKLQELYEQERKLRQELEAEVERRIEFTRALVHELKTPLTPVLSSSELLIAEFHEEPWLSIARNIHRGASNLSKRIDDLLDLARVEIGMLQVNPSPLDPKPLLRAIADEMTALVSSSGQSLFLALAHSMSRVWADEERLRQVVLNLLINASKFTPEGGKITLRAREDSNSLIVEVQDTGRGIPEEEQSRIFQPYHRQITDREHLSGLGLGLSLCKYLVELHGGKIWVESQVGKGSTFGFSIPLAAPTAAGQPEKTSKEGVTDESPAH
ncbi:MAG: PAS domain-containing sensor histidine kinase [Dehalococcoidales bacterium]|nr:PAS domain-containing sensor histidine kinase [Dehalococcoidales bacterium]